MLFAVVRVPRIAAHGDFLKKCSLLVKKNVKAPTMVVSQNQAYLIGGPHNVKMHATCGFLHIPCSMQLHQIPVSQSMCKTHQRSLSDEKQAHPIPKKSGKKDRSLRNQSSKLKKKKEAHGCCQNCGTFLGTLNIRCRIIVGIRKGTIILITTHITHHNPNITLILP